MAESLVAFAFVLILTGCSGAESTTTVEETTTTGNTVEETTTAAVEESTTTKPDLVAMTITFDGEECTYDGPGELLPGDVEIINHNKSSEEVWVWFGRLDEGRNLQEVIDWVDATPTAGEPPWTRRAFMREISGGDSWEGVRYLGSGLISVVCGTAEDDHAYYGSGFTVTG